jgi:DNA-binding LytR/AlgR family response regulator
MNNMVYEKNGVKHKSRLIVQRGNDYILVNLTDVVLIHLSKNVVYVIDKEGRKFIAGHNLNHTYSLLDQEVFFRANRQFIININFIRSFKTYERVKVVVEMSLPEFRHPIILSQEKAAVFRKWIIGLS